MFCFLLFSIFPESKTQKYTHNKIFVKVSDNELAKTITKRHTVYTKWNKHIYMHEFWILTQAPPSLSNRNDAVLWMIILQLFALVEMRMLNEVVNSKYVLLREPEIHFCVWGVLQFGWWSQVNSWYIRTNDKYIPLLWQPLY